MQRALGLAALVGAAVVIALLVWPRSARQPAPAAAPPPPAATAPAPPAAASAVAVPATGATAVPVAPSGVTSTMAPLPTGPAGAGGKIANVPAAVPLSKQEKLDLLAPLVSDLEQRVARLRHEADEDERAGHADAAKLKRVAADRHEHRLGEVRSALANGELPPGFVNPSHEE